MDPRVWSDGCSMELQGGSSKGSAFTKKSYKLVFPEDHQYEGDADWPGYFRKMYMRAEFSDHTLMRNFVAHQLLREATDLAVPRYEHVKMFINGAYHGVMLHSEKPKRAFLKHNGYDSENPIYRPKPEDVNGTYDGIEVDNDMNALGSGRMSPLPADLYPYAFSSENGVSLDPLITFIEDVLMVDFNNNGSLLTRETTNVEKTNDYLAAMGILYATDMVKKNYYLTRQADPADNSVRWEPVPWDLDLTFGCTYRSNNSAGEETFCRDTMDTDSGADIRREEIDFYSIPYGVEPQFGDAGTWNLWHDRMYKEPEWKEEIQLAVCDMLNRDIWQQLPDLLDALTEFLRPAVEQDTNRRRTGNGQWEQGVEAIRTYITDREVFLREQFDCVDYVRETPQNQNIFWVTGVGGMFVSAAIAAAVVVANVLRVQRESEPEEKEKEEKFEKAQMTLDL